MGLDNILLKQESVKQENTGEDNLKGSSQPLDNEQQAENEGDKSDAEKVEATKKNPQEAVAKRKEKPPAAAGGEKPTCAKSERIRQEIAAIESRLGQRRLKKFATTGRPSPKKKKTGSSSSR